PLTPSGAALPRIMRAGTRRLSAGRGGGMSKSGSARVALGFGGVRALVAAATLGVALHCASPASAVDVSPFESLTGRWVGEGRLGVRGGPTEQVRCRVTYVLADTADQLKQAIRCASAGGKVEVRSVV